MFFVVTQAESPAEVTNAVVPATGDVPAAADAVSGLTATQFAIHAQTATEARDAVAAC